MERTWYRFFRRRVSAGILCFLLLCSGCSAFKRFAYEGIGRDGWQYPTEVIRSLNIEPGERVADLGSGGGYFTFRLAEAVGPKGTVYAVAVDSDMTEYVAEHAKETGAENVVVILAKYDDPLLPSAGVDLILTVNTYHHVENRERYFAHARKYVRPGGRVAIIDFNDESWLQRLFGHLSDADETQQEMEAAGYRMQEQWNFLPRQDFLVFTVDAD